MSFAISVDQGRVEWGSDGLHSVFAQRTNALSPTFLRMLWDMRRCVAFHVLLVFLWFLSLSSFSGFLSLPSCAHSLSECSFNRDALELLKETDEKKQRITLGDYLKQHGYSDGFRDYYLIPMAASVWSTPATQMLDFPALTLIRFFHNHSLMQVFDRPMWRTVRMGSREYVKAVLKTVKDIRLSCPVTAVRRNLDGTVCSFFRSSLYCCPSR